MRVALLALAACGGGHVEPISGRAPVPSPERMVAVVVGGDESSLAIAKVTREAVRTLAQDIPGDQFGWLDAHTLVVADTSAGSSTEISQFTDGRRAGGFHVTAEAWPDQGSVELLLAGGTAWLSKCTDTCERRAYLEILPVRRESVNSPRDLDAGRATRRTGAAGPRPPTAAAPPGITLSLGPVDVTVEEPMAGSPPTHVEKRPGVTCRAGTATRTYPARGSSMIEESARAVRWVSARPPVFEIELEATNPAGFKHLEYVYARPCEAELDGYAWLGDDMWAAFVQDHHDPELGFGPGEPPRLDGDWTFYAADRAIGTLHGLGSLRPNLVR